MAQPRIRWINLHDGNVGDIGRFQFFGRATGADGIKRRITRNDPQPGNRSAARRIILPRASPNAQIGFLQHIFGRGAVAQNAKDNRKKARRCQCI